MKDENDLNLKPEKVCEIIENLLYNGAKSSDVIISDIYSISKDDEFE